MEQIEARKQVHTANAVAPCPPCAALYKYARERRNDALLQTLASIEVEEGQGGVEIPLVLNGKRIKIRFTGKHVIDLQAALGVAGAGSPCCRGAQLRGAGQFSGGGRLRAGRGRKPPGVRCAAGQ